MPAIIFWAFWSKFMVYNTPVNGIPSEKHKLTYLRPVRSLPKKLTTPTLKTKLENTVNRPAMPARHSK